MAGCHCNSVILELVTTDSPRYSLPLPDNSVHGSPGFGFKEPGCKRQDCQACLFEGVVERAGVQETGTPVLDLSLACTSYSAWHAEEAPSPHSPIDTHFLLSGTHQRITEYQGLGQGLVYTK